MVDLEKAAAIGSLLLCALALALAGHAATADQAKIKIHPGIWAEFQGYLDKIGSTRKGAFAVSLDGYANGMKYCPGGGGRCRPWESYATGALQTCKRYAAPGVECVIFAKDREILVDKSTLLLQVTSILSLPEYGAKRVAYISGEESVHQIQGRANRLGHGVTPLELAHEKDCSAIVSLIQSGAFDLVVVDSIQTVFYPQLDAVPGSVSQVKSCANDLVAAAKASDTVLVLVGHVTKDGTIAGPKTIEHMDCG